MKKLISLSLFLSLSLSLTSCGTDSWQQDVSYLKLEQIEKAQTKIDENLELLSENEEDITVNFQLGYYYQTLGDYKTAEKYYLRTVELDPNFFTAYNNLSVIYEELEKYDLAAENINALWKIQTVPNRIEALSDGVRINLKNDDPDTAQAILENFIQSLSPERKAELQSLISDNYEKIFNYRTKNEK